MQPPQVDGLAVLSELTDDALLVSNLLRLPVSGRERIAKVMEALEAHFTGISDIERINTASHRIIKSRARLPSGSLIKMTVVGTRNDMGWISEVVLTAKGHGDDLDALTCLATIVERAAAD